MGVKSAVKVVWSLSYCICFNVLTYVSLFPVLIDQLLKLILV